MRDIAEQSYSAMDRLRRGLHFSGSEIQDAFKRIYERASAALKAASCCSSTVTSHGAMQRPTVPIAARSSYAGTSSSATLSGSHCSAPSRPIRAPYDFGGSSSQPVQGAGWPSSRPHFDGGGSSSQPLPTAGWPSSRPHFDGGGSSSQPLPSAGWTPSRPHFDGGGVMQSPHRPSSSSTYTPTRPTSTQWPSMMPGIYFLITCTYHFICFLHISTNDLAKTQATLMVT